MWESPAQIIYRLVSHYGPQTRSAELSSQPNKWLIVLNHWALGQFVTQRYSSSQQWYSDLIKISNHNKTNTSNNKTSRKYIYILTKRRYRTTGEVGTVCVCVWSEFLHQGWYLKNHLDNYLVIEYYSAISVLTLPMCLQLHWHLS